jgi:hypothetical protein
VLLEETHYYPFGLAMAGISSKALKPGYAENKSKFQGEEFDSKEFSDGSSLDMCEFEWRMHDPQIGRIGKLTFSSQLCILTFMIPIFIEI